MWKHTPQRSLLRRALFQIHLWVGIAVSIYAVVIGLTGSLLVFSTEIEGWLEPQVHFVVPEKSSVSLQDEWEWVKAKHPEHRVLSLGLPDAPDHAATFALAPKGPLNRAKILNVYFNLYTGKVLGEQTTVEGPLGWVRNLHYFLFAGETGLIVNGWMAFGLLLLCVTGVVIWWPGILRWKRSLVVSWRSNWKRMNWGLHSSVGFWCCAALLVVGFTGVYFAFPNVIGGLTLVTTRSDIKTTLALMQPSKALPHAKDTSVISLDEVVAKGSKELPQQPLSYVQLPVGPGAVFTVTQYPQGASPYSRMSSVDIDPYTGKILRRLNTAQYPLGMRIVQYYHAVHFGSFGGRGVFGRFVQWLWVLLGLTPAVLAVTGLLMYWNRYLNQLQRRSV
ncbi:MAG TPA: PepSY-associated TM helix domain-containing protein [Edaphobacter sp.]|nr:PepSY-associated TM helix domain-containing protein [Edaphobacter sp.]